MTDLSELGCAMYGIDYGDRLSSEIRCAAINIAIDAKSRQSEQALAPLREALKAELDLVGSGEIHPNKAGGVALCATQIRRLSQWGAADNTDLPSKPNDDIANIIRGLEQLIEERRGT